MARQPLSLRARAVTLLAQRDHSELELRRKLGRIARQAAADATGFAADGAAESHADAVGAEADESRTPDLGQQVEEVLVWLRQQGYLDESRFVESRLHVRSARWGQRRIEQELAQHGLSLDADQRSSLAETELSRACELLRRKFSAVVAWDAAQEARQMRFLLGRGFQSDVARRAIRALKSADESA
ncbi:regulatory protein RecX [Roseateles terrae]|uniref:Regulatory protein RecX n=1 Tax=Roseateles terrae TaxID=431060 RepID=A0ABR6GVK1_9BURK|nr:regulatory protein RecX [Roseateles terrae]MBB3196144.1 regulatory protein [Roseateles terrae]OWQ85393.1 hypothetical protein CDN98_15800 [Roseateles terrae]